MTILMRRRGLLLGMASLLAAPAVVRAESLMPVRGEPLIQGEFAYWRKLTNTFNWTFASETKFLTRPDWELAFPSEKASGAYCWSNPVTGHPCEQLITKAGLVIADIPDVMRRHAFDLHGA